MKLVLRAWRAAAVLMGTVAMAAHANLPTVPSTPAPVPAPGVGMGGLFQAAFGMACVLGLILLCAWLARRFGLQRFGGGHVVKVISSTSVGQRERVVVVEVADQWLVLGVTPQNIHTLHTLPAQATPAAHPATPAMRAPEPLANATQAFSQLLRQSLGIKARAGS
ncbi:flagellar biosynthetic protein FliO [Variovorax sp. OV329]|uniref:flagellar biosynthetic protein FliO n=1 Tax=Variovorax sp. OV329 TaxID=1882825 RepID=UPI0008F048FE|nr:flagellar biosynthetic protein FliO [Variovorax sp. OV329]SFM65701.1 flagellar protein FliO/FliZ [Variovorax sp. OV329]